MLEEKGNPSNHGSFARHVIATMKDLRLWGIVVPSLILSGLAVSFVSAQFATILTLGIGLLASFLINRIHELPQVQPNFATDSFYERVLFPALVGILCISGAEVFARLWLMPWHLSHGENVVPSCSYLLTGGAFDWLGLVISVVVVAILMGRRADFAIMFGFAFYIPLSITDLFAGQVAEKSARLVESSCKWYSADATDFDLSAFRIGMATGIVSRALLAMFVAKLIMSWRSARANSSTEVQKST
jgi:hypothetical protein